MMRTVGSRNTMPRHFVGCQWKFSRALSRGTVPYLWCRVSREHGNKVVKELSCTCDTSIDATFEAVICWKMLVYLTRSLLLFYSFRSLFPELLLLMYPCFPEFLKYTIMIMCVLEAARILVANFRYSTKHKMFQEQTMY